MSVLERMGLKKQRNEPLREVQDMQENQPLREATAQPLKETFKGGDLVSEPDHLRGLCGTADPIAFQDGEDVEQGSEVLTRDQWGQMFAGAFSFTGAITQLETLKGVSYEDELSAQAFNALYDTFEEIPALRFLLSPGGKWTGRVMAIGMFSVLLYLGVNAELKARRFNAMQPREEEPKAEETPEQPANDVEEKTDNEIPVGFNMEGVE